MGIVTPLILSIVVCVALRLISYTRTHPDCIVDENKTRSYRTRDKTRSYRTREQDQILSYMGFNEGKGKKSKRGSPTCLRSEVKSERNNGYLEAHVAELLIEHGANVNICNWQLRADSKTRHVGAWVWQVRRVTAGISRFKVQC